MTMNRIAVSAGVALLALGVSASTHAQGGYAELGISDTTIELGNLDESDTGFRVLGGYGVSMGPQGALSGELFYEDFGEAEQGSAKIETTTVGLGGRYAYAVTPEFEPFGRLGIRRWDSELSSPSVSADDDGTDLYYGVGLQVNIEQFYGALSYEFGELEDADATSLYLSAGLKF